MVKSKLHNIKKQCYGCGKEYPVEHSEVYCDCKGYLYPVSQYYELVPAPGDVERGKAGAQGRRIII